MARRIPFPTGPAWSQRVQIQGVTYTLQARWNDRAGAWTLDIGTREGDLIARGVRLVADYPLLASTVDARLPSGELFVVSASGEPAQNDPGRNDFEDGEMRLVFFPLPDGAPDE